MNKFYHLRFYFSLIFSEIEPIHFAGTYYDFDFQPGFWDNGFGWAGSSSAREPTTKKGDNFIEKTFKEYGKLPAAQPFCFLNFSIYSKERINKSQIQITYTTVYTLKYI